MALLESSSVEAVMKSPIPIAALSIVCFVAWRQMSLVKSVVALTLETISKQFESHSAKQASQFKDQAERQDKFMKDFSDSSIRFTEKQAVSEALMTEKLHATNVLVTELNGKLSGIPVLIDQTVSQKVNGLKTTGEAIEQRLDRLERATAILVKERK